MEEIRCKFCKGKNNYKKGYRKTDRRGKVQKHYCKDCKRIFTEDLGFYRMRFSEKTITMSLDMYISNLSSRKMRNQLGRHLSVKVSHMSILDWVRRYTLKVSKYVEKLEVRKNPVHL